MTVRNEARSPTPTRGTVVELDRERRIRFTLAAIEEIDERFGVDVVAGDALSFGDVDEIAWLVALGLRHAGEQPDWDPSPWERLFVLFGLREPPRMDADWAKRHVDMENLVSVSRALVQAVGSAKADAEDLERTIGRAGSDPTRAVTREKGREAAKTH